MPLYDFVCTHCGHEFEEVTSPDAPAPVCPDCESAETERRLAAPGIKRNAPPFKIGPKRPMAPVRNAGPCAGGGCGGCIS